MSGIGSAEARDREAKRTTITVGISDCAISSDAAAMLVTHALGSCIAVVIRDAVTGVSGLLHFMLPDSTHDPTRAVTKPYVYADSGIPLLFRSAYEAGGAKQRLRVALFGGASVLHTEDSFQIGKRNHLAARKILWKAGVMIHHEDVGGTSPRTVRLEVGTGRTIVTQGAQATELLLKA